MKTCIRCSSTKEASEFYSDRTRSDNLHPYCKECHRNDGIQRRKCPKRKQAQKRRSRSFALAQYGLTIQEYRSLLEKQNEVCAICHQTCSSGKKLSVDHCHDTGKIRGLLCSKCNTGLGYFSDSPELLRKAAEYLCL